MENFELNDTITVWCGPFGFTGEIVLIEEEGITVRENDGEEVYYNYDLIKIEKNGCIVLFGKYSDNCEVETDDNGVPKY